MKQQRPLRGGQGSYARIIQNVRPLLAMQRRMQDSARVTVTPGNLRLRETLDELLALGFHSVGFSPMLHAPSGQSEMTQKALVEMLEQMTECGEEMLRQTIAGKRYAFSNLATALQQFTKGRIDLILAAREEGISALRRTGIFMLVIASSKIRNASSAMSGKG